MKKIAPNNTNSKKTALKQTPSSSITKLILEKPHALRLNKNASNIPSSQNGMGEMLVLDDLVKRLDAISIDIGSMNDSFADLKNEVEILNARQNQMLTFIERADNNFTNIFERLERAKPKRAKELLKRAKKARPNKNKNYKEVTNDNIEEVSEINIAEPTTSNSGTENIDQQDKNLETVIENNNTNLSQKPILNRKPYAGQYRIFIILRFSTSGLP
ncbi:unnamed protein product [Brachionus calyciflorus]|uniref:Uncharacterized protein n=1 Tax=Brachionus calyciflorus TaxID=104777 RepID=A0A813V7L8_9BILA|nr:unnamed protein product [Brachionus calyciflorus]